MQPVNSSTISHVAHDAVAKTLTVRFHNGTTYTYPDVTADEHLALLAAPSIGKHFGTHIRSKHKGVRHGSN